MISRIMASGACLAILASLSNIPWGSPQTNGLLRLSWRTNGERVRVVKAQDPSLPAHMRLPENQAYELKMRPYHLKLRLDGQELLEKEIVAAGIHHDRPLSVFEEFKLTPGKHEFDLEFAPQALGEAEAPPQNRPFHADVNCVAGHAYLLTLDEAGNWIFHD